MKPYLVLAIACLCFPSVQATPTPSPQAASAHAHASEKADARQRAAIGKLLASYAQSLNASDVKGVVRLYTDDAVLLAPDAPSAVGIQAVQDAYTGTFGAISLNIAFEIAELKLLSPEWALLRTNSTGTIKILANGAQIPEGNQELFLLRKSRGDWKIARYSFSSFLRPAK